MDEIGNKKKDIIIMSSATKLCELMDEKIITSYEILLTFIERTIKIGLKNNYVVDEMFYEAI